MRTEASRSTSVGMMRVMIAVRTLTDGGQQPVEIAHALADFAGAAARTLEIAVYDFALGPETEPIVHGALEDAAHRGVAVRLAYNVDHRAPIAVPPPPKSVPEDIATLDFPTRGIAGIPDLMHHKYVVRDAEALWMGSANWTDDSWSREENVIAQIESAPLAHAYLIDF